MDWIDDNFKLAKLLGAKEALFLLYLKSFGLGPDNWIRKTSSQITDAIGLSKAEQLNVRSKLVQLGLLKERLVGIPAGLEYQIQADKLKEILK